MPDGSAGVWEAVPPGAGAAGLVRRVRELDDAQLAPVLHILGSDALDAPACDAGQREGTWTPGACVVSLPPPCAGPGGGGVDLAAVAAVVGLNAALRPEAALVWASPPLAAEVTIHRLEVLAARAPAVRDGAVAFAAGAVHTDYARLSLPAVIRLTSDAPRLPKRPLFPGPKRGADGGLPFSGVRVRSGMAACAETPLVRVRRAPPPGQRDAQAFAAERRQLARSAQSELDDVMLLGVYPMVPVAAVRRLALDEDGRALSLWLKPEALSAALAGREPRLVTLIVGRLRSTGRMIQAVG